MSTVEPAACSGGKAATEGGGPQRRPRARFFRLTSTRRIVLLILLAAFMLQFARVGLAVGGLSGSTAFWLIELIDVFGFLESLVASRGASRTALVAVLPVLAVYLLFGRAFCGWVCPMDYVFEVVARVQAGAVRRAELRLADVSAPSWPRYAMTAACLSASLLLGVPFFTRYLSHLTSFFRALSGGVDWLLDVPGDPVVPLVSLGIIGLLLILEALWPRLWCRRLCPVGAVYGLLNRVSLLRLSFRGNACTECARCDEACYMKVPVVTWARRKTLRHPDCIYCGKCVEACENGQGIIRLALGGKSW